MDVLEDSMEGTDMWGWGWGLRCLMDAKMRVKVVTEFGDGVDAIEFVS